MAKNQTGIAIVIKAFLPTGATIDEQFTALSIVKDAHASGDYTALLKAAKVDEVKTEQKTRRVEDEPATTADNTAGTGETEQSQEGETKPEIKDDGEAPTTEGEKQATLLDGDNEPDATVPGFIKKGKRQAA